MLTHLWPFVHLPQLKVPPQPSEAVPQLKPSPEHVSGVQEETHPCVGAHCFPAGQLPQSIVPPQPSEAVPHL